MSNRNFQFVPLNDDQRARRKVFKLAKKAYEGDVVLQSTSQAKQVADLYDIVIDAMNKSIASFYEIILGIDIELKDTEEYTYTEGDFNRNIVARAIPQVLQQADIIYINLVKLIRNINFLTQEQIQELVDKLTLYEDKYIEMSKDFLNILLDLDEDKPNSIEKISGLSNELDTAVLKIINLKEALENIPRVSTSIEPIQNPQSVSGGYSARPFVSNRKFL
jgi:RNA processing factor Prp31